MNILETFTRNLRQVDARPSILYLESLFRTNVLLKSIDMETLERSGIFFVSAPPKILLGDVGVFEHGFKERGYKLLDRLPTVLISLKAEAEFELCILDPYFSPPELRKPCQNTRIRGTVAGAWQFAPLSETKCCIEACNFFFPLVFITRKEASIFSYSDNKLHKGVWSSALCIAVDAFDNDGFLFWRKLNSR